MKNTLKVFAVLCLGVLFPVLASANIEVVNHTIVSNGAMNGSTQTVSGDYTFNGTGFVIAEGSNMTFNFVPNSGYHVADVIIDGVSQGPITTYTFSNIVTDHEVTPSFAINEAPVIPVVSDPSTDENQDGPAGIISTPSTNPNQDDAIASTTPTPEPTPAVVSSGGSSSGSRVSFIPFATSTASTTSIITITSCNYLTSYLKFGADNDSNEVTKLQTFLKNIENINVDINGIFDDKTFEGVKAFQVKYLEETMVPWGSRTPSGQVFFTTRKKINEVYCKSPFALTAEQLAQINAYKNNLAQGIIGTNPEVNAESTSTSPVNQEIGSTNDNNSQTAAVANISATNKVWNFIKWLFGK